MSVTPAEIILRRRSELGLSQAQLAERIGRAASTIRRWERSEANPPASILPALASALQVAPRDLAVAFGIEDDRTPPPEPAAAPSNVTSVPPPSPATPDVVVPPTPPPEPAAAPSNVASVPPPAPDVVVPPTPPPEPAAVPAPAPPRAESPDTAMADRPTEAVAVQTAVAAPPQQRPARRSPLRRAPALDPSEGLSYVESTRQRARYWLRAALTVVAGIILLIILFWAVGELGAALSDVWDLFGDDAPPGTAPGTDF